MKKYRLYLTTVIALFVLMILPGAAHANSYDTASDLAFADKWTDYQYIAENDEVWYKVTAPSDGEYELRVMSYADASFEYELMSQDLGITYFEGYFDDGTDTSPVTSVFTMPLVKGTYYLKLRNGRWEDPAKFKMKNAFTSYGANDAAAYSFDSPQVYTPGTTITGLIGEVDPEDWFKVVIERGGSYTLSTRNFFDDSYDIDIRNSDSSESVWSGYCGAGSETSPNVDNDTISLTPGTYYIKISCSYTGGKYMFSLNAPPEPACSHDYSYVTVKPTYFRKGYTRYTCTICGDTFTSDIKAKKKLAKGKIISLKPKKKKASLKWRVVKAATGYQVRYSTKKSMKKAKKRTLTRKTARSLTVKKLKRGKTYWFQVRVYKKTEGKIVYGKWSSKKKARIK